MLVSPWTTEAAGIPALGNFRGTTLCLLTSPPSTCIRKVSILRLLIRSCNLELRRRNSRDPSSRVRWRTPEEPSGGRVPAGSEHLRGPVHGPEDAGRD